MCHSREISERLAFLNQFPKAARFSSAIASLAHQKSCRNATNNPREVPSIHNRSVKLTSQNPNDFIAMYLGHLRHPLAVRHLVVASWVKGWLLLPKVGVHQFSKPQRLLGRRSNLPAPSGAAETGEEPVCKPRQFLGTLCRQPGQPQPLEAPINRCPELRCPGSSGATVRGS